MDAAKTPLPESAERELEAELETWDWARAAGVSADELREALRALLIAPELRKAA
jgi:hypothetical protein